MNANEMTHGVSLEGIEEYKKQINFDAFDKAQEAFNITNLEKVFQVVRAGWIGQAEETFEAEVYQAAIKVIELIGQMRDTLLNNIDLLGELVIQQDSEIKGREFSFK